MIQHDYDRLFSQQRTARANYENCLNDIHRLNQLTAEAQARADKARTRYEKARQDFAHCATKLPVYSEEADDR